MLLGFAYVIREDCIEVLGIVLLLTAITFHRRLRKIMMLKALIPLPALVMTRWQP
jgi:hypothetical protein